MAQSVGAANLAAGLQDAYLGLSPVIALTGHKRHDEQYRNAYQEIEHSKPFASVTKFSAVVENVDQLPRLLRQAFREATTGAPAPVHLDIQGMAGDVVTEAEADLEFIIEESFMQRPAFRPEADPESVRQAARVLSAAQRPVIVAGGGVTASQAQREVVELAEMLSIPVATSLNAKGAIPDSHPLSVGVVGSYSRWCANRVVHEADLVLYIGSHTGSQVTNEWRVPRSWNTGYPDRHRPVGAGPQLSGAGRSPRRRQSHDQEAHRGPRTHREPQRVDGASPAIGRGMA